MLASSGQVFVCSLKIKIIRAMDSGVSKIKDFTDFLGKDKRIQALVKAAKTPDQILEIAESVGIKISMKQLRFWSRELTAPYFPWAEKGNQWRREFFLGMHRE